MSEALALWKRFSGKPLGKWMFSRLICWKVPYFSTIAPRFEALSFGHARVSMKKRRAVHNHIGTVHAIAVCNLAELAGGTMLEASLPRSMRWLPRGMNVQYLKKAETDLVAEAGVANPTVDLAEGPARDVVVGVDIKDRAGNVVVHADISMYVSPRRQST